MVNAAWPESHALVVAQSHIGRLQLTDHVFRVVTRRIVSLVLRVVFGADISARVSVSQRNRYTLVIGLVRVGIRVLPDIASADDFATVWDVGVGLNRCGFFTCHVSKLLLLAKHSLFVLGNLGLVVGDLVPVNLAGASVHGGLVEALAVLLLLIDLVAHHLRLLLVAVEVVHSQALLTFRVLSGGSIIWTQIDHGFVDALEADIIF